MLFIMYVYDSAFHNTVNNLSFLGIILPTLECDNFNYNVLIGCPLSNVVNNDTNF